MKASLFLLLTPFALAAACGGIVQGEPEGDDHSQKIVGHPEHDAATTPSDTATATATATGTSAGGAEIVHCAPASTVAPSVTATCSAGSDCSIVGDRIVCGPPPATLNCGRVNCTGRCKCLIADGPNNSCACY